ncbi:hypothetical protein E1B28_004938 [Marasmius oreades]|uniref:3-beta hydroxysteroid dehydrogenase/isomerase domain-containing protein n=1 Tax=Marasmius oreades TaxID=181124 RepID=A0A9P8ADH4_9AGAR|nr:uncharacterized protein E1B28_004938 [Marasmius oreades]KAG7097604.1 hypothetical protein E1B28_004938 [Marasmius oreades]
MTFAGFALYTLVFLASLFLYVRFNDRTLRVIPNRALEFSPERCTSKNVLSTSARLQRGPAISVDDQIPPKTGRRYIVTGGAGFLGGWIVFHLIRRGEDPRNIRVLDIRPPTRKDLRAGIGKGVDYRIVDVSNADAVREAFEASWPNGPESPITVFHTAANIRFYERDASLVSASTRVNVVGTMNVLNSARAIGASILISTSSASLGGRTTNLFLRPWQKEPEFFVQVINDDDTLLPKRHQDFFSNYAFTKREGEKLVRAADRSPSGNGIIRTGCIRPGNGVFGPGGDMLFGAYLVRRVNPTWISHVIQNAVYVENCVLAHLLYERRLLDLKDNSTTNPDIGGDAFCITDPGPPPTYGDVYTTLSTLTDGETAFPELSLTGLLIFSYLIEFYYLLRNRLLSSSLWPFLKFLLPPINGDLVNLQPSLFHFVSVHLIFDDSRARLPPEKGGLGYKGAWTTIEGLHELVKHHKSGSNRSEQRSDMAGVSFGFGLFKAQRGVAKVGEKVKQEIGIDPVTTLGTATK